jgi:hypothetical protein
MVSGQSQVSDGAITGFKINNDLTSNFVIVFGHAAVGIIGVSSVLVVGIGAGIGFTPSTSTSSMPMDN